MYISSYWKKLDSKIPATREAREARRGAERRLRAAERRDQQQRLADAQPERARELAADQDRRRVGVGRLGREALERALDEVVAEVGHLGDARGVDAAQAHRDDLARVAAHHALGVEIGRRGDHAVGVRDRREHARS